MLDCINMGSACPALNLPDPPFVQPGPYRSTRATRASYPSFQDGVLWTTLGTGLQGIGGSSYDFANDLQQEKLDTKAGVASFGFQPSWSGGMLGAAIAQQGYVTVDGADLTYPSLAIGANGVGYIGATLVGPKFFASPAYVKIGSACSRPSSRSSRKGPARTTDSRVHGKEISSHAGVTMATRCPTTTGRSGSRPEYTQSRCAIRSVLEGCRLRLLTGDLRELEYPRHPSVRVSWSAEAGIGARSRVPISASNGRVKSEQREIRRARPSGAGLRSTCVTPWSVAEVERRACVTCGERCQST